MKFRYKKYGEATRYTVLRPVIPVEVKYQSNSVRYEVLVDSGADLCIFDEQIGRLLGIDIKSGRKGKVFGITGEEGEEYYIHPITMNVGGWDHKINAAFKKLSNVSYGVVGQLGFFDKFIVKFDLLKGEIELKDRLN